MKRSFYSRVLIANNRSAFIFAKLGCSQGTCELRLFSSPKRLRFFLFPADARARGGSIETLEEEELKRIEMKTIRYSMTPKLV